VEFWNGVARNEDLDWELWLRWEEENESFIFITHSYVVTSVYSINNEKRSPECYLSQITGMNEQFPRDITNEPEKGTVPYRIELVVQLNVDAELVHLPPLLEPIDIA